MSCIPGEQQQGLAAAALPHLEPNTSPELLLPQLRLLQKQENKKIERQQAPSRRVCYANGSGFHLHRTAAAASAPSATWTEAQEDFCCDTEKSGALI